MPFGDRTGPTGAGPMTGRAAGFCAGYSNSAGRGGVGIGRGMGRGRGFRRGFGWPGIANPYPANTSFEASATAGQDVEGLKQEAEFLQSSLSQINERIEQLEKTDAQ